MPPHPPCSSARRRRTRAGHPARSERRVRNMEIVELEFGLHRREAEAYSVELRITRPDSDADPRVNSRFPVSQIDLEAIRRQKYDVEALGRLLADCLFADSRLRTVFAEARTVADAGNAALRLRLFV